MIYPLEELNIIDVIEEALKIYLTSLTKENIEVVRDYRSKPRVWVQRVKIIHTLHNIIKNSIEAMSEISELNRKLTLTVFEDHAGKYIRIQDTGCGIPAGELENIFAFGYTTKEGQNGFDLHICANYVNEMQGKIWAESEGTGKGTTLVLQFK